MKILAHPRRDIHTGNPYVDLLFSQVELSGCTVEEFSLKALLLRRYDIIHIHWPQGLFQGRRGWLVLARGGLWLLAFALAKLRGAKLVWTVHNILPHNRSTWTKPWLFSRYFLAMVDGVVFLSEASVQPARDAYPKLRDLPAAVIPHGHYRSVYTPSSRELSAKRFTLGFFGSIKRYKNVGQLLSAFKQSTLQENCFLHVAGKPESPELQAELVGIAAGVASITLDSRHIADAEIPGLLAGFSLCVLPFEEILNSGSAILALSLGCPVLVPDKGAMKELQELVGERWVKTFAGSLDADVLRAAVDWARDRRAEEAPDLSALDWPPLARRHVDFYSALLNSGSKTPSG